MKVYIYSLICPIDKNPKYIGWTKDISKRLYKHIYESLKDTKTRKKAWINKLHKLNLTPEIFILDEVDYKEFEFWEQHYIYLFKSWGFNLYNLTNGGESNKIVSIETKEKLRKANIGKKHSIETKQKMSLKKQGKLPPYIANQNGVHTESQTEKISKNWFNVNHIPWNKGKTDYNLTGGKLAKKVFVYENEILIKEFVSRKQASIFFNCSEQTIDNYCKNNKNYKSYKLKLGE